MTPKLTNSISIKPIRNLKNVPSNGFFICIFYQITAIYVILPVTHHLIFQQHKNRPKAVFVPTL